MHPTERHAAQALVAEAEKACRDQAWIEHFRLQPDVLFPRTVTTAMATVEDDEDGGRLLPFVAIELTGRPVNDLDGEATVRIAVTHGNLVDLIAQLVTAHNHMHRTR